MRTSRTGSLVCLALATWAQLGVGCQHRSSSAEGTTSFRILEPPSRSSGKGDAEIDLGQPREVFVPAELILPVVNPVYPPAALKARSAGAVISLHVVVGAAGSVSSVTPSVFGFSVPGPFANEFQAAAEGAVSRWKFQPAEVQWLEAGTDEAGNVRRKIARRERVETSFDVSFMFTATGEVVPRTR